MKKDMIKKALLSLSIAFAATAVVGVGAVVNTNADDEATINPAFSTLALQNGASIRYAAEGEEPTQEGFSYVLQMSTEAYNAVIAEDSAFSDVKFGILIGPEAYYDVHAFDNQDNLDAYYSLNVETEGKAFLYDLQATEFVGNDETVYYRGSIVEVLDANMIRDYRGVGYVEYTVDGATEKFFFTDDSNVRCPVEIADLTIDTLDAETDAAKIEALKTRYINQVDWTITPDVDEAGVWYSVWTNYQLINEGVAKKPEVSWNTANRYINSRYTTVYQLERAGEEPIVATLDNNGNYYFNSTDCEGIWTVKGYTTCSLWDDETPIESYSRDITFNQFYTMPAINGANVMIGDGYNNADPYAGGNQMILNTWDEATGRYNFNKSHGWVMGYGKAATGDFIVDFDIEAASRKDFRIYTATDKYIAFRSQECGTNGIYVRVSTWGGCGKLLGTADVYTSPKNHSANMKFRVAMYNDVLFLFGKTYTNEAGEVVERENWLHLATLNDTGLIGANGIAFQRDGGTDQGAQFVAMKTAAVNDQYGFAVAANGYSTATAYMTLEDNDEAVATFMDSIDYGGLFVNGVFVSNSNGSAFVQDENGYYNNASTAATRVIDKASGDYMLALKLKSTNEFDFKVYYSATQYFSIVSAASQGQDCIFMDANGAWWSETRIGFNTAKFVNDDVVVAENQADGYLDVMLVRYNGVYYIYSCEYLDESGKVATFDNWQLLIQFNADKTTPVGEGFTIKDANWAVQSNVNGNLSNATVAASTAIENAFALKTRSAEGFSAKMVLNDTDADVAAFMNSDKAVATYAKA